MPADQPNEKRELPHDPLRPASTSHASPEDQGARGERVAAPREASRVSERESAQESAGGVDRKVHRLASAEKSSTPAEVNQNLINSLRELIAKAKRGEIRVAAMAWQEWDAPMEKYSGWWRRVLATFGGANADTHAAIHVAVRALMLHCDGNIIMETAPDARAVKELDPDGLDEEIPDQGELSLGDEFRDE